MKQRSMLLLGLLAAGLIALGLTLPAAASPAPQVFLQTPTALPDGRILYTVKGGDTCTSVALQMNITIDELRALNNIKSDDCALREGQQLLIAVVEVQPSATPGPSPTPGEALPSPTPFAGNGAICVYLYNDLNGDALAEETETPLAGGAISITDRIGKVSLTGTTTDVVNADTGVVEPVCFEKVPEGEYNISIAVPEGYNATTDTNYALKLRAGDQSTLDFGAQPNTSAVPGAAETNRRNPLLGILGGLLVVAGVGLGIYFRQMRK